VLAYHGVTRDPEVVFGAADPRFFAVRLAQFRAQMQFLAGAGYETMTPDEYEAWVAGGDVDLPEKPVLITFDDGETSTQLATPVLEEHDFAAVMFVVSGFADGDYGGPNGEPDWYLTWDQLADMAATGHWLVQFHAGPKGHAFVRDPDFPACHRFYPCRFGEDDATYQTRVKTDIAQGLGAIRTSFGLPDDWQSATFAVPWDDVAGPNDTTHEPWLGAYFATQFPVVFLQNKYRGPVDNQRYRSEIHNPDDLDAFERGLLSPRFAR
jgi:hypothetical protein